MPDRCVADLRERGYLLFEGFLGADELAAGADPKVVQRVLGHATAAMTMDLYGHMIDANLWQAAQLVGDISGTSEPPGRSIRTNNRPGEGTKNS